MVTEGSGFVETRIGRKTFVRYSSSDGMPSDVVFQIIEDNQAAFAITRPGLALFGILKPGSVRRVYTVTDRLLSNHSSTGSRVTNLEEGIIYFG